MVALQPGFDIFVITSAYDHNSKEILAGIETDRWTEVTLPGTGAGIKVWYVDKEKSSVGFYKSVVSNINPAAVYLNGMFSLRFVIFPLLAFRSSKFKLVLCPRGMLQVGALAGKSLKKKIYLTVLKLSGLLKQVTWHATNAAEEVDIERIFGDKARVIVAANIAKAPYKIPAPATKVSGSLRLVYLSLIAAKKNLLQVIELLIKSHAGVTLDIYGPVKDEAYWQQCTQAINKSQGRINYLGDLRPEEVQETFVQYDASILLTRGENFGHALYESMSVGRPVITSFFTPWNNLEQKTAGWNLDTADEDACLRAIAYICSLDMETMNTYGKGAHTIAMDYFTETAGLTGYHKLFAV